MEVVSVCPLRVASVVWQPRPGSFAQTIVCKASYVLAPGESKLDAEHDPPFEADAYWNDDERRSLREASDLAPAKPRADVIVVGSVHAPEQNPVRALTIRLVVGAIDKAISVHADSAWLLDGTLREGPRFAKMPLVWERAGGGPDTTNPAGIRADGPPDPYGMLAVPNFRPVGSHLAGRGAFVPSVGLGPIAPRWPQRANKVYRHGAVFPHGAWQERPLYDIELSYFNVAPSDQQIDVLHNNERIVLENLHPAEPRFVTNLAPITPRARVERRTGTSDVALRCDTLILDTDRCRAHMVWRGQIPLERRDEPGRVTFSLDDGAARRPAAPTPASRGLTQTADATSIEAAMAAMPFTAPRPGSTSAAPSKSGAAPASAPRHPTGTMPTFQPPDVPVPAFMATGAPGAPPSPALAPDHRLSSIPASPAPATLGAAPVPTAGFGVPLAAAPVPTAGFGAPLPGGAVPPLFAPPPPVEQGLSIGQRAAQQAALEAALAEPPRSPPPGSDKAAGKTLVSEDGGSAAASPAQGAAGAAGGVAAASNAAAATGRVLPAGKESDAAPRAAPRATRDIVDLLWFDPALPGRLREVPAFEKLIGELAPKEEPKKDDFGFDDEPPPPPKKASPEVTERREIQIVLSRGDAVDTEGLHDAVAGAVTEEGAFDPPLCLIAGELFFPFDEIEALRATLTAAAPLAPTDKKLKDTIDTANEVMKTLGTQGSPAVAEGLNTRVREAFAQANRTLPATYLDAQTERVLLEQRHYQKRTLFGEPRIRALLTPPGASAPIPTYLPEALAKQLPLFQRFRARLLVDAHLSQDQYETHALSLRGVAVGRLLPVPARR